MLDSTKSDLNDYGTSMLGGYFILHCGIINPIQPPNIKYLSTLPQADFITLSLRSPNIFA